jgi:hypothetical protein
VDRLACLYPSQLKHYKREPGGLTQHVIGDKVLWIFEDVHFNEAACFREQATTLFAQVYKGQFFSFTGITICRRIDRLYSRVISDSRPCKIDDDIFIVLTGIKVIEKRGDRAKE